MDLACFNGTGPVFEGSYTAEALLNAIEFKKQTYQFTPWSRDLIPALTGRGCNAWRQSLCENSGIDRFRWSRLSLSDCHLLLLVAALSVHRFFRQIVDSIFEARVLAEEPQRHGSDGAVA